MFQQHQTRRRQFDDLTAQFRADRAAGAGNQHMLAADTAAQQVQSRRHGVAAQQVLDGHVLNLVQAGAAAGDVVEGGHGLHADIQLFQPVHQCHAAVPGEGRQGQQHRGHRALLCLGLQALAVDHRHAAQQRALLAGVVVHHQHRVQLTAGL